jgi:hypothetical protein
MEKRRKTMSEEQRELNRWVMELANYLMAEKGIDDKTALRKAHLTRNLLRALGEGKVTFSYRKQDGSLRTAHGTLRHGICREFDEYRYASDEAEDTASEWPYSHFVYWDLDRQGFRSFRAEDLEDYNRQSNDFKDRVTY